MFDELFVERNLFDDVGLGRDNDHMTILLGSINLVPKTVSELRGGRSYLWSKSATEYSVESGKNEG